MLGGIKSSQHISRIVIHIKQCLEGNRPGAETQNNKVLGGSWLAVESLGLSLPPSLSQSVRWWPWGPSGHSRSGKHPEIKQMEKSQSDGFPWTWGNKGKDQ